jgi:cobalt-zinc-cadmium resistance protein CzcA
MNYFFLKYKGPIAAILVLILLGGMFSLNTMKTSLFPDITFPKIKIIAENGEQPVDKMMVTVTIPLENAIKRVEELKFVRSITSRGSCEISAFLNWGSDVDLGKQRVEAQINAIKQNLPPDLSVTIEKMNPSILPVMGFSLEGEGKSPIELRQLAEFTVKPILSRIEGISEVGVIGGKVKEFHIVLDPIKMSNLRITPASISSVLSQSNFIESNGFLADYNRLYLTLTDAAIDAKTELENTIIVNSPKGKVRLKDIARIEIGERREYIKINANGKDVPLVAVMKQPKANLLDVTNAVQRRLKEIQDVLPKGVTLRPFYNQADFVGDSIRSLKDVLWIGLVLAIFVVVLFLRSLKASSALFVTIPITLSLTLVVLHTLGYTFNIMTIGAIAAAIGLIIDDAIIVVEQIHRTHEEHPEEKSANLVVKAIRYLLPAMVGSSLSTIVIFLPFILMSGVAGAYFKVMTNSMIITLACSFLVVWIGLPVVYILSSHEKHSVKRGSKLLERGNWAGKLIRRPAITGCFILILVLLAGFILPRLPSGFLPDMDEGSIVLDYKSPPGSSLEATDAMLKIVDEILQRTPEVESFSRRTGTQLGFFITEPNDGDYLIQLKKQRSKTTDEVTDDIRARIEAVLPSLQIDFGQVIGDMLGDLMASVQPIEVKIFGDDHTKLAVLADSVADLVERTRGTADVFNGLTIAGPEVEFEPKIANLAQYQLTPSDFQFQMQTKIEGTVVGGILEKNRVVDIRMLEDVRAVSIHNLKRGFLFLNDGRLKPVDEFADLTISGGVAEIERENLKPMVAVTARLNNRDLGSTLKEIREKVKSRITLPPGYQIVYGGAYAEQQQAFKELLSILISAVMLVFIVILFLFRSIKVSIGIMAIAVLGISGSVLALFVTSMPLNVGSYTGIIMIVGIIGENAIFTYQQYLEGRKNRLDRDDALVDAISKRLRPNLMTALGAISALAPLALGMGAGAQMHQPLAVAIIGGFVVALPLLLVVLPTILRIIEK